jgi:MFS family permease
MSAFVLKIASLVFILIPGQIYLLFIYGFLAGLGNSQLSGALDAWFDSNYKILSKNFDPERKIYTHFTGKLYSAYLAVAGIGCLISGTIGMTISRDLLFIIEIAVYAVILVLILIYITPIHKTKDQSDQKKNTLHQYFQVFKNGLRFAFSKASFICFFIGYAIFNGFMEGVWTKLILFPYYNSYAGTDFYTGLFRWIVLTFDIFLVLLLREIPAKSKNPQRGYLLSLLGIPISLIIMMGYYILFPSVELITTWGFIRLLLIAFTLAIPYRLTFLFFAKIMIDFVPNEIRNSIYSLLPTLTLIINIPAALLGGKMLETYGIPLTILIVAGSCLLGVLLQAYGLLSQKEKFSETEIKS